MRQVRAPLVASLKGEHYTYDGISSMLRRSIETANVRRSARGVEKMESFGFRDLKGKGATDMYYACQAADRGNPAADRPRQQNHDRNLCQAPLAGGRRAEHGGDGLNIQTTGY